MRLHRFPLLLALLWPAPVLFAQSVPIPIIVDRDLLPSGASIGNVTTPNVNAAGQVLVRGNSVSLGTNQFLWFDGNVIAEAGGTLGGTGGEPIVFVGALTSARQVNASGQVVHTGRIDAATTADFYLAIDGDVIALEGTIVPSIDPTNAVDFFTSPSIDDAGVITCIVEFELATPDDQRIVEFPPGGTPTTLAMNATSSFQEGTVIVGGPLAGTSWGTNPFLGAVVNGSGTRLVRGLLATGGQTTNLDDGVLVSKGPSTDYVLLAREGNAVSLPLGGSAAVSSIVRAAIAEDGSWGAVLDTDAATTTDQVVVRGSANAQGVPIAQEGQDLSALLGIPGTTLGSFDALSVESGGSCTFVALIGNDGVNVPPYTTGIFRWDGTSLSVIGTNDATVAAYPGSPRLARFVPGDLATNDGGAIVIQGDLDDVTTDGIFAWIEPTVAPVEALRCTTEFTTPDLIDLGWTHPGGADGIRISIDGTVVATLPGDATSFTTPTVAGPGVVLVEVVPFVGSDEAPAISCRVAVAPAIDVAGCLPTDTIISYVDPVASVIPIADDVPIEDVIVAVDLFHPSLTTLAIDVTSPAGTSVRLHSGGVITDDVRTTFADFGAPPAGILTRSRYVRPSGPGALADFRCETSGGDWTLEIYDSGVTNDGLLTEWCVGIVESPGGLDCCPRPTAFSAVSLGSCNGPGVFLSWDAPGSYTQLQLVRDNGIDPPVTIPLASAATDFTDLAVTAGESLTYTLEYICAGGSLVQTSVPLAVTVDATAVPPVVDLRLERQFCGGRVVLTWDDRGVDYDTVSVEMNFSPIGDATGQDFFVDAAPPASGTYRVVVTCGGVTSATSASLAFELPAPTEFTCEPAPGGGTQLSWVNHESYNMVELLRDGVPVSPPPAIGASSYLDPTPTTTCATYTLTVGCAAATATVVCTNSSIDPLAPITDDVLMVGDNIHRTVHLFSRDCGGYIRPLFDPRDLPSHINLSVPHNAVLGPDGLVYLSDQGDSPQILRFAQDGTFVDVFGSFPGDNIRGIDFRGSDLLVAYGSGNFFFSGGVRVLDAQGVDQGDLVTGGGFWDVHVLPDDRFLAAQDFGNEVRLYEADGSAFTSVVTGIAFPDQITELATGSFLVTDFTGNAIIEFDLLGTILGNTPVAPATENPRGTVSLDNGFTFLTSLPGVFAVDLFAASLAPLDVGFNPRLVEVLPAPSSPPPQFVRGDVNDDGTVNLTDAIVLLAVIFPPAGGAPTIGCDDGADANDDGTIDLADPLAMLASMFFLPAVPLPDPNAQGGCGIDPTPGDPFGCAQFDSCP